VATSLIQDKKGIGSNYHELGVLRTKPGRGYPTKSMSCSDKITKWLILGIQGSLLTNFLTAPIYLTAIVVGDCPYNNEAMKRSLIYRSEKIDIVKLPENFKLTSPHFLKSNLLFKFSKLAKNDEQIKKVEDNNDDDLNSTPNCKLNIEIIFHFIIFYFLISFFMCI
jgi:hypothetical protein